METEGKKRNKNRNKWWLRSNFTGYNRVTPVCARMPIWGSFSSLTAPSGSLRLSPPQSPGWCPGPTLLTIEGLLVHFVSLWLPWTTLKCLCTWEAFSGSHKYYWMITICWLLWSLLVTENFQRLCRSWVRAWALKLDSLWNLVVLLAVYLQQVTPPPLSAHRGW